MRADDGLLLGVGVPAASRTELKPLFALRVSADDLPFGPRPLAASGRGVPPARGGTLEPIPRYASVDGVSPATCAAVFKRVGRE